MYVFTIRHPRGTHVVGVSECASRWHGSIDPSIKVSTSHSFLSIDTGGYGVVSVLHSSASAR